MSDLETKIVYLVQYQRENDTIWHMKHKCHAEGDGVDLVEAFRKARGSWKWRLIKETTRSTEVIW